LLAGTGLQPFQVLRMATLDAAEALGLSKEQGRIAEGMRADLVLVAGDPLRDVAEARKIVATIVRGRVFTSETLLRSPIVEDSYAEPTPAPAFP
jgi:imidazolonepropionase-like amidohydrolase